MKGILTTILILLCTALVESAILSNIVILPAVPDILLLASLYLSTLNGRGPGAVYGFVSGLFIDFLGGAPLGFACLVRTIICYIGGIFGTFIGFTGFFMPCVLGFTATITKVILIWLVSLFYPSIVINYNPFSVAFFFELVANTFLAPVIFKLLSSFVRLLSFSQVTPLDDF